MSYNIEIISGRISNMIMTVVFSSKMDTCPFQNRFLNSCDPQNFIFLMNVKK